MSVGTALVGAALVGASVAGAAPAEPPGAASELDRARDLHRQGERTAALVHYRAFLRDPAATPDDRATALNNVCVLLHDLGELSDAQNACEEALALRRDLGDERRLSRTLNNLGLVLQTAGRYDEARRAYREALASNRARGDEPAAAVNLANLGLLAGDEGRYGLALDRHLEVEALAARHEGEPWAEEQRRVAWINRGVVYEKLGAYDQALDLYRRLVAEEEAAVSAGAGDGDGRGGGVLGPRRWATVLLNLGTVYRNLGDPHQAAAAYRRAAEIFAREDDRPALASVRLNLGQVLHADLRRPDEAEEELERSLALARDVGDRGVEIQALFLLGENDLERDPEAARKRFSLCLDLARQSGSAEGTWWARYGLGRLAARDGDLDASLEHLRAALEVLERTRGRVGDRDLRSGFFAGWRHVYEAAVEVLWRRTQRDVDTNGGTEDDRLEAFALVQRAKERELVEALGGVRPASDPDLASLRTALGRLDGSPRPAAHATLLEFFVTDDGLHSFRLDAEAQDGTPGLRWWRTEGPAAADAARRVQAALADTEAPLAGDLRALASQLGPPLEGAAERLVVAPDGALRYLPFEILPAPEAAQDGRPGARLLDRHVVSYLPSASALLRRVVDGGGQRPSPRYGLVALADPATGPGVSSRFVLDPLTAGRRESERAAERIPGESLVLVGEEATLAGLRRGLADGTRVLHLAAHAVIDERPGGGAAVLLAPDGTDGRMGPAELARLDLRADLTVLAACSTALPPSSGPAARTSGRAFGSLTGSLLAAGSDAVLATLWDVGDEATAVFMEQFYYELGQGLEPAMALAQGKRRLAKDPQWQAPHLWAGYVLVGDAGPVIPAGPGVGAIGAALGVGAVLVLAWLALRRVRRRRR